MSSTQFAEEIVILLEERIYSFVEVIFEKLTFTYTFVFYGFAVKCAFHWMQIRVEFSIVMYRSNIFSNGDDQAIDYTSSSQNSCIHFNIRTMNSPADIFCFDLTDTLAL
ncbi:uncharacterized protein BDR25DRAFT_350443 [Lindgomyces ingoldianus]|uniref:Uncharacterized protein n=1 Tax=Lindgomyces ingoldianus TaxID=673940 RepID=A0ACB6RBR5_9PLEO|nr:uncharacterized protein BDR25DRAFT_350443 [Lindgomyces ingoldianus]KAF2476155.1 hypothetical protein BDR25DRAFT_350443 [Lindgomyces ingoldianus]